MKALPRLLLPVSAAQIVIALAMLAPAAHAQINLAWNNCRGVGSYNSNLNYACDGSRSSPIVLVLTFRPPTPVPDFTGMRATIGLDSGESPLQDYWRLGVGECARDHLEFPAPLDGIGNVTCRNPWSGAPLTSAWAWTSDAPRPGRAHATFAVSRDGSVPLNEWQHYIGAAIAIDADREGCSGCVVPNCIEVIEVEILQAGGDAGTIVLTDPEVRKWVTWQGGPPQLYCLFEEPDPVQNHTWGRVKATYR